MRKSISSLIINSFLITIFIGTIVLMLPFSTARGGITIDTNESKVNGVKDIVTQPVTMDAPGIGFCDSGDCPPGCLYRKNLDSNRFAKEVQSNGFGD
ncbi:MAG: hypothetical protein JSV88_05305 [Candidatus Aminicenantes bacterium]|nr:MAG: hypothetical protein JSV88_05305 [Candidatus Aminicenantes bacterium]